VRGSLSGVRSRVDRLALKLAPVQVGCPSCRGKEQEPKVVAFYGQHAPEPGEAQCEQCGRIIPYRYIFIGYDANMKPADMK
jgi:hypothetical protein